ncbi:MAG: extracellular solute-binding protein [Chloroflexi bacterium]|nr:extracellular solute-binding protein [Chloroflexota bacterium]
MRKLPLFLVLILVAAAFSSVSAQDEVTLEFWGGWTGPDGAIMQQLVDQYSAENPNVNVNLTVQAWSPLFDSFIAAASAGESPDIMAMHPQETAMFINLGLIKPIDEIIAASEVFQQDAYVQKAWDLQFYQGQMYAFPFDLGVHGLFYNVDLFEEAGLSGPPTNAEEFLEAARLLTKDANGNHPGDANFDPANIVQYAVNMQTNHHAFYQWYALYGQLGGQLLSEDGMECVMDIDKATQAWEWLQDLVYVHYAAPQGQTDYARDFLTGRTAMLIDGPWQIPAMEAAEAETVSTGRPPPTRQSSTSRRPGAAAITSPCRPSPTRRSGMRPSPSSSGWHRIRSAGWRPANCRSATTSSPRMTSRR